MKKLQLFGTLMGYRNRVLASNELILHTNVAGNLIKPMWCVSKPLKHQKVRFFLFSTGIGKKH